MRVVRLARRAEARPLPTPLSAYVVFASVLLFPAALKVVKAVDMTEGRLAVADLGRVLAADVALAFLSFGVALALGRALRGVRFGALLYFALTTLYLAALLGLSAIEHQAWARSSSLLDWNIFIYTIEHYQEMRAIIAAETTLLGVLLLVCGGVLAIAPALCDIVAAKLLGVELRFRRATVPLLGALPFALAATTTPEAPALHPLKQSAVVGLLAGAFSAADDARQKTTNFRAPDAGAVRRRIESALDSAGLALPADGRPKNVLLVVLESTRFDATSVYVPRLATTPELRKLADAGVTVKRALVDIPHTSKALVSILCGYSPRFSVQTSETEPGGLARPCLPHALGRLGYRRAFFQAATGSYESRHQFALNAGYDEIYTRESYDEAGFEETNYLSVEDKVMLDPIGRWLDTHGNEPFFLTLLTCITHHSYGLPSSFSLRHYPRQPPEIGGRMPRPWSDYNRYLNTVRYADELLAGVLAHLRQRKLLDDTLVVVVGDHGQGFFEHGQKAHNTVIWEEGLRVPLVLHNPQLFPEPRVVEGLRRQVDIAPTILTQLGVAFPSDFFEGRDLLSGPEHERAYSSCWYDRRCAAETTGFMRVIDHFDTKPMEVYDLEADPFERTNLLATGSTEQRAHWTAEAKAARQRMARHQAAIEQRYLSAPEADTEFLLEQAPKPQFELRAQLEGSIELLGYDTPSLRVAPDSFWEAVIYFRCLAPSTEGWRLFGVLETLDGREDQVDRHPANGRFYLHQCKPGTVVADHVRVWIPGDFPPGEARYWWGSVLLKDLGHVTRENRRLGRREITPLQRGVLVRDQALLLAKLQVEPKYRTDLAELRKTAILTKAPVVKQSLETRFGDNLVLMEARVEPKKVRRRASVTVTTVWRVEGKQSGPWQINVHLDSDRAGFWFRRAHTPVDGVHPISAWRPGTWIVDTHAIPVPDYLPSGGAKVWVGLRTSGKRMEVSEPGRAEVLDRRVLAGAVEITP